MKSIAFLFNQSDKFDSYQICQYPSTFTGTLLPVYLVARVDSRAGPTVCCSHWLASFLLQYVWPLEVSGASGATCVNVLFQASPTRLHHLYCPALWVCGYGCWSIPCLEIDHHSHIHKHSKTVGMGIGTLSEIDHHSHIHKHSKTVGMGIGTLSKVDHHTTIAVPGRNNSHFVLNHSWGRERCMVLTLPY